MNPTTISWNARILPFGANRTGKRPAPVRQRMGVTLCQLDSKPDLAQQIGKIAVTALAAAALVVALPQPASAVSGGGGLSNALSFQDLSGQDLRKLKLTKGDLRGANFSNANMTGVTMFGAICVDTKFVGTNLTGADLESADLEGADLSNAVLQGALLQNAQFRLIKSIEGADFTDALLRKDVAMSLCKIASGTNPITGVDTKESLMCP